MKLEKFLESNGVQKNELEIIIKIFKNEIAASITDINLSDCSNYQLHIPHYLKSLARIRIFLNNHAIKFREKQNLFILLTKIKCGSKVKTLICDYIVRSNLRAYKKYLEHFVTPNNLSSEIQELICKDIDNYDIYIPILINNDYFDILLKIFTFEIDADFYIDIVKYLYLRSKDKKYLDKLEQNFPSRYLEFCFKNNIKVSEEKFVKFLIMIEFLIKNNHDENCKWLIYWMLKLDITKINKICNILRANAIDFQDIFHM